jgi:hypothetical protein
LVPIPSDGAWPPPQLAPAYQSYRDWDAWYDGSPAKLREVYSNRDAAGRSLPPSQRTRAGQYAGGIWGTVSRWLWGAPTTAGARGGRLHVPLPAGLSATTANLLFSEPPKLTHEDKDVQARLEQLEEDGPATLLLHVAKSNSALGDVYLRRSSTRASSLTGRTFLAAAHADGAILKIRWGKLIEVTCRSDATRRRRHPCPATRARRRPCGRGCTAVGRIQYALHEGISRALGRAVPLSHYAAAAHLADLVDEEGAQATGLERLDVVRIPNAGPQWQWHTEASLTYLGRSDFDGTEQWFDALDDM